MGRKSRLKWLGRIWRYRHAGVKGDTTLKERYLKLFSTHRKFKP